MNYKEKLMSESFRDNYEQFIARAQYIPTPPFPTRLMLSVTTKCNHNCIFCRPRATTNIPAREIEYSFAEKVLHDAYALGSTECSFTGNAEPFLYPHIDKLVALAKEIGYEYIYLTSNGTGCTTEKMQKTLEAGLDSIKLSINAGNQEDYKKVHGVDGFIQATKMLDFIINWREKYNPKLKVYVSCVACDENKSSLSILQTRYKDSINAIEIMEAAYPGYKAQIPIEKLFQRTKNICPEPFTRLNISVDGEMRACCGDARGYTVIGSLADMPLDKLWHSDAFITLRKGILENNLPKQSLCNACVNKIETHILPFLECIKDK